MHVNGGLAEPLPDFLRGEPTTRQIGQHEQAQSRRAGRKKSGRERQRAAQSRRQQLPLPFVRMFLLLEKFHVALQDFWEGKIFPAPELRRGRAGDTGDGRGAGLLFDRDRVADFRRQRPVAGVAIVPAGEQAATLCRVGGAHLLDLRHHAPGQPGVGGRAQRGHVDGLAGAVNGHGFERRLGAQRGGDRLHEAAGDARFVGVGTVHAVRFTHKQYSHRPRRLHQF